MIKSSINSATYSLKKFNEHQPQTISKYSDLAKLFKIKKNDTRICMTCQEIWPCRDYAYYAGEMSESLEKVLDEHNELRQAFDKIARMQAESLSRIAMARDALTTNYETNIDEVIEIDD